MTTRLAQYTDRQAHVLEPKSATKPARELGRKLPQFQKTALITTMILLSGCAVAGRDADSQGTNMTTPNKYETVFDTTISEGGVYYRPILLRASDGGYVVAGSGSLGNTSIIKTDQSGKTLWQQQVSHGGGTGSNQSNVLMEMPDGGYAVAGQIPSSALSGFQLNSNFPSDLRSKTIPIAYVAKFDKNGQPLWTKGYDSVKVETYASSFIRGVATSDGAIFIGNALENLRDNKTGQKYSNNAIRITKIDIAGNLLWEKSIPGIDGLYFSSEIASKIVADPQGNLIFSYAQQGNWRPDGKAAVVFFKIDQDGNLLKRFDFFGQLEAVLASDGKGLRIAVFQDFEKPEIIEMTYDLVISSRRFLNTEFAHWVLLPDTSGGMHFFGCKRSNNLVTKACYPSVVYYDKSYNSTAAQTLAGALPVKSKGDAVLGNSKDEIVLVRADPSGELRVPSKVLLTKVRLLK
jgi:hypothetical protein